MISRYSNTTPFHFIESDVEFEIQLPKGVVQKHSILVCEYCKERRKGFYVTSKDKMRKRFVCTEHIIKHNLVEYIEHTSVFKPAVNRKWR